MIADDWVTLVFRAVTVGILFWLVIQSRRWTGPVQSLRMEVLEDEHKSLRGNFHRFERETQANLHDMQECLRNILGEVQTIRQNGAKEHPLEDEVRQLRDRVEDVEQAIHGLPCGQVMTAACPAKE